ncbi:tryptophan 7-halogenase [Microbulbifer thermotolerans]|uniref:Tryptophan 7-halogenase n=1 Tax=Microbulbifer thermotolerans TaxID=252514 RepID=A0AB35HYV3_MICTH|nr:tryptophan halogenase family protein [Microbulbifer thermotolerans]MCX2802424.1 tryptophan 7-halogenase [Microbulbifer thermotolerans]
MKDKFDLDDRIRHIVVVGGGSTGWIAAAVLAHQFKPDVCKVTLVESEDIGTIGVGESTIPPFIGLLRGLGIDEADFIQKTQASFKLGIQFHDWLEKGQSYFHPFGVLGQRLGIIEFYQAWLWAQLNGHSSELQDHAPCAVMAREGRFYLPQKAQKTPIGGASYALHLDAKLAGRYLRNYAEARGVERVEGRVVEVFSHDNGFIDKVRLTDGREISGDFFIDCSGFRALLIEQQLGVEFEDWKDFLPCNRAVAVQTENTGATTPYTQASAESAGWRWRIPLQHRTGNGYVFDTRFISDDEARARLLEAVDGKPITEPALIPFRTGIRTELWKHNCLSLGLASGFIEPLESTAIHLVTRGMDFFLRFFSGKSCDTELAAEYNRRMRLDYEEIRDFVVMHYCLTRRRDTPFWRWWQEEAEIPQTLRERIALFRCQGALREGIDELFHSPSWFSVFEGMGVRPRRYDARLDNLPAAQIIQHQETARAAIAQMVDTLPSHDDFLREHCPAVTINN